MHLYVSLQFVTVNGELELRLVRVLLFGYCVAVVVILEEHPNAEPDEKLGAYI